MKLPGDVDARDGTWLGLASGRVGVAWLVVAGRVAEGREPEGPGAAVVESAVLFPVIPHRWPYTFLRRERTFTNLKIAAR